MFWGLCLWDKSAKMGCFSPKMPPFHHFWVNLAYLGQFYSVWMISSSLLACGVSPDANASPFIKIHSLCSRNITVAAALTVWRPLKGEQAAAGQRPPEGLWASLEAVLCAKVRGIQILFWWHFWYESWASQGKKHRIVCTQCWELQ